MKLPASRRAHSNLRLKYDKATFTRVDCLLKVSFACTISLKCEKNLVLPLYSENIKGDATSLRVRAREHTLYA